MGVYIKGMEMPQNCRACMFSRTDIRNVDWCVMTEKDLPCECPLVPVPPHGRLIAEDDAIETAWMILRGLGYLKEENPKLEQTVREVFATAPAIEVE